MTIEDELYAVGYEFNFFQVVRLLEALARAPEQEPPPVEELARFVAHQSLNFPPSSVHTIERPPTGGVPRVTQTFFGLTGVQGALPVPYTEMILKQGTKRTALRDWLDLFNHRATALFYRAWAKYRFPVAFTAQAGVADPARRRHDPFTQSLLAFVGLGSKGLANRLRVDAADDPPRPLAHVEDLALLHYGGLFAHRPRNAAGLEAVLADYFHRQVRVLQFTGQWLALEPTSQTRMPVYDERTRSEVGEVNCALGQNAVAGERVWDVVSKFRVRVGPLRYAEFIEFLPDPAAVPARKAAFLLGHLARLYVGPEFDFEVQLVLLGREVPECRIQEVEEGDLGVRLGWNTWLPGDEMPNEVDDVIFDAPEEVLVPAAHELP